MRVKCETNEKKISSCHTRFNKNKNSEKINQPFKIVNDTETQYSKMKYNTVKILLMNCKNRLWKKKITPPADI